MRQAASHFIGEHDFRNFCKMDLEHVKSFRRTMLDFQVIEIQPAGADGRALYALHVKGTAFLWHQVKLIKHVCFQGRGYMHNLDYISGPPV